MAKIDRVNVEVGTLLTNRSGGYGRVGRLTKTQAVCYTVEGDLETARTYLRKLSEFRVMLDKEDRYGITRRGGKERGTGSDWSAGTYWHVTTETDAREAIKEAAIEAEKQKAARDRKRAKADAEHAENVEAVRDAWENREAVDAEMGLWKVTIRNRRDERLVIVYTVEDHEMMRGKTVYVRATVWSVDRHGHTGAGSTSRQGPTELDAIASFRGW